MTLSEHMKELAAGDMTSFDEIYRQTQRAVYHIALSVVRERMLAEDVMQSCYMKVIKNAAQYRGGSVGAWVGRIARNEAINLLKRRSREYSVDEKENEFLFGTRETEAGGLTDLAQRLLPQDEFSILLLVAADKYKRREVAQMLGLPLATVTWKYNRAIGKMKKALEEMQ